MVWLQLLQNSIFNYFAYNAKTIKCYDHVRFVRKHTPEFNKDERNNIFLSFYFSKLN